MPRNEGLEIDVQSQPRERAAFRDAALELVGLPYVRMTQRSRPPRERRGMWLLLALVLLAHIVLAWLAWWFLRPAPYRYGGGGVIAVMLVEPTPNLPPPPPLVAPPPLPGQPAPPRRLHYVPPAKGAIQATLEGVAGPPLELYESNGQIRLPSNAPPQPAPAPAFSVPALQGSQIYGGKSPLPYQPTRFNKDWAPSNQSLGARAAHKVGDVFDKAVDKTTLKKTIKVGGIRIHCAIAPLLLMAAGCHGDAPPPPAPNEDDIRLSMPPAETLTGKKVQIPEPASSAAPAASRQPPPAAASSQ
ncbi:MAG TPA: hypothetical protein VFY97_09335 [Rhodanobacteraceae bacterium]|nr:hypothetical protein [Rhodanobacteraceae bacterium]